MKIIYEAVDGIQFNTEDACVKYEKSISDFKMYDEHGLTENVGCSYVLELPHEWSADSFLSRCKAQGSPHLSEGIKSGDMGLYAWDIQQDRFFYLDDDVANALRQYFNLNKEE